jgi:anti-sigma B factor antagonist
MEIRSSRDEGSARVDVVGELDVAGGAAFDQAIGRALEDGCREVVVDLAQTTFLDSSGMGALIRAARAVDERGGSMTVLSPPGSEGRVVIEMARIGDIVGLRDA